MMGLPLDTLMMSSTDVQDLSPITNMPLLFLHIAPSNITNVHVIFQTDIRYLHFNHKQFTKDELEQFRSSKIKYLNGLKREVF